MVTELRLNRGYLLPAWKPVRPGESEAHQRVRLLVHNARQPGHNPAIHSEIDKLLLGILRPINPECKETPKIARHLGRYFVEKNPGISEAKLNNLVSGTFDELTINVEQTRTALRDELADIWKAAKHHILTDSVIMINARNLLGKYSLYLVDFLFGQPCFDYVRSQHFLDHARNRPEPEPAPPPPTPLPAVTLSSLEQHQADVPASRTAVQPPEEPKLDLPSLLRETIFAKHRQILVEGIKQNKYLQGVYHLLEREALMRENDLQGELLVVHPALIDRGRELVHDLTDHKLEQLGFPLDLLAGTGRDSKDLLVEAFPLFRLTRQYLESAPVKTEPRKPKRSPVPEPAVEVIKSKYDIEREKIFAGHPRGPFIQRIYKRLGTRPERVDVKQLEKAKQLICNSTYEDFGKMKIWHSTVDGEALTLFEFVVRCLPLFNLNRRDFAYLDWTTPESGKANVVYRFYKYNPDLRPAIEAADSRLAAIKNEAQLEPGELEPLVQLRGRLIKLITKNNLIKWGLDRHRKCPGIQSNTELIQNCFPFTVHHIFSRIPWPQKRTRLDTVLDQPGDQKTT